MTKTPRTIGAAWLCLVAGCGRADEDLQGFEPLVRSDGRVATAALGEWRTRGYGHRMRLGATSIEALSQTESFIYRLPKEVNDFLGTALYRPGEEGDTLLVSEHPDLGWWVLDRVAPAKGVRPLDGWTPPERLQVFVETMREHYAFFDLWNVNWEARAAAAIPRVGPDTSDQELFDICAEMLAGIDDAHFGFSAEIDGEVRALEFGKGPTKHRIRELFHAQSEVVDFNTFFQTWHRAYIERIEEEILQGDFQRDGALRYGWLEGDVAYLQVTSMSSPGGADLREGIAIFRQQLDDVFAYFEGARGLILDLSYNQGGVDLFGLEIAGRFADRERLACRKWAVGARAPRVECYVRPTVDRPFTQSTYVLVSDITMSAAESLALYMRVLPNVTIAGQRTRGALSDVLEKPLPHNTHLALSNEIYVDPDGACFERVGIPPDIEIVVFDPENPWEGHDLAVERLRTLVLRPADATGAKH